MRKKQQEKEKKKSTQALTDDFLGLADEAQLFVVLPYHPVAVAHHQRVLPDQRSSNHIFVFVSLILSVLLGGDEAYTGPLFHVKPAFTLPDHPDAQHHGQQQPHIQRFHLELVDPPHH
jgi:hypothetical protein